MMLSDVLLNGKAVLELSTICHASKARDRAKAVVFKLKNELPKQQFAIAIQVSEDKVNMTEYSIYIKIHNATHNNKPRIILTDQLKVSIN